MNIGNAFIWVVANDVLPCFAALTKDRAPIILIEKANAFDGVRLFFIGRDRVGDGTIGAGRTQRRGDRVRIRGGVRDGEGGGICHSPTDDPLSGHNKMK